MNAVTQIKLPSALQAYLVTARCALGYSIYHAAEIAGLTETEIALYEEGYTPDGESLWRLAFAYGAPYETLLQLAGAKDHYYLQMTPYCRRQYDAFQRIQKETIEFPDACLFKAEAFLDGGLSVEMRNIRRDMRIKFAAYPGGAQYIVMEDETGYFLLESHVTPETLQAAADWFARA